MDGGRCLDTEPRLMQPEVTITIERVSLPAELVSAACQMGEFVLCMARCPANGPCASGEIQKESRGG
jgi:hypothetical protein